MWEGPSTLQIRTGHTSYIVNTGGQEWVSPPHFDVAGSGKCPSKDDAEVGPDMLCSLTSSEDWSVFNVAILTVGKPINYQKAPGPDASFCYHNIALDDASPKIFTLKPVCCIVFYPVAFVFWG